MRYVRSVVLAVLCVGTARADDGSGETTFKTRNYAPGKSFDGHAYSASSYAPSSQKSAGTAYTAPAAGTGSRWTPFASKTEALPDKQTSDTPMKKGDTYTPGEPVKVPTIETPAKDAPEVKPFISSNEKLSNKTYTPPAPTNEKNPLLAPRQGIKVNQ